MIDSKTAALLQTIVRREGRSLLQYVSEAFPWITDQEKDALAKLQQLTAQERDGVTRLAEFLIRQRITPPYLGAYPMEFTTINYVSLDHLLPLLVAHQRRAIPDLERDLSQIADSEARTEVQAILDAKRQHLQSLESLAAVHPEPAVR
jgi:hypothetical protein